MQPLYRESKKHYEIFLTKAKHDPPHLHKSVEFVYVIEGTLEIGVGKELYHMEKGDFAIVFPEVIHHYQVFDPIPGKVVYLMLDPAYTGSYLSYLQQYCPENPVIKEKELHEDITYAMNSLWKQRKELNSIMIPQAFVQIMLTHALPVYTLIEKSSMGPEDIVYQ
ncbi:MAG: cupin domain-containing protein, partial [Ruminococcus sp.]